MLPLSALQHYLYCPRQCALIHLEQAWAENRFTAEGNLMHARAHDAPDESRPGIRITHSLPVSSQTLGISGQCDVVEFHQNGTIIPIEYKRGKPKAHSADEVQLCAQAICLEEMSGIPIPEAFLFYGKRRRRTPIAIDTALRDLTISTAKRLHSLISEGITPQSTYAAQQCDACSLIEICQPKSLRLKRGAEAWFQSQIPNL
ncbi:MAG: CRISPR-associated protein Cas4 [Akkermansiaceae bacterium]|nr:CRISPR-associated protein Cas4 [Akkermansiaceae bacterium]